jgi:hypothetical protein
VGALKVRIGAAVLGADQVGGLDSFPRSCGRFSPEDDRRLRTETVVGAAHEVGILDVVQESGVQSGRVVVVDAYRPVRVRGDWDGIGTAAQGREIFAGGRRNELMYTRRRTAGCSPAWEATIPP